jgi:hypothetical protein
MRRNTQSTLKGFSHLLAGLAIAAWVGMAAATGAAALDAGNATASADPSESARAAGRVQAIGPDPGKGFVRLPGHVLGLPVH